MWFGLVWSAPVLPRFEGSASSLCIYSIHYVRRYVIGFWKDCQASRAGRREQKHTFYVRRNFIKHWHTKRLLHSVLRNDRVNSRAAAAGRTREREEWRRRRGGGSQFAKIDKRVQAKTCWNPRLTSWATRYVRSRCLAFRDVFVTTFFAERIKRHYT